MFYRDERLALFIDGSNLYATAKSLGFDIDYKLLRQEFMRRGKLVRAFYYTALLENDEYSPIHQRPNWRVLVVFKKCSVVKCTNQLPATHEFLP